MKRQIKRFVYLLFSLVFLATGALGLAGPASADTVVPLSSLAAGDTVHFAGYTWIILNPGTGYLLMQNQDALTRMPFDSLRKTVFDPTDENNIGYYLNVTFYDSLPYGASSVIQTHSWTTGNDSNEASISVQAKISLISCSEYHTYQNVAGVGVDHYWWTRTPYSGSEGAPDVLVVAPPGDQQTVPGIGNAGIGMVYDFANNAGSEGCPAVRPVLYLNPGINVSGGNGGTVLTVSSDDVIVLTNCAAGGTVTGGGTYDPGTSVSVTAAPNNGFNFAGWTDDNGAQVSTNPTYSFTAPAAGGNLAQSTLVIPLVANFMPVPLIQVANGVQFSIVISGPGGDLNGSYNGPYGTVTGTGGNEKGVIIIGTLHNLPTVNPTGFALGNGPTDIPLGNGVIEVEAIKPPATSLATGSFY